MNSTSSNATPGLAQSSNKIPETRMSYTCGGV